MEIESKTNQSTYSETPSFIAFLIAILLIVIIWFGRDAFNDISRVYTYLKNPSDFKVYNVRIDNWHEGERILYGYSPDLKGNRVPIYFYDLNNQHVKKSNNSEIYFYKDQNRTYAPYISTFFTEDGKIIKENRGVWYKVGYLINQEYAIYIPSLEDISFKNYCIKHASKFIILVIILLIIPIFIIFKIFIKIYEYKTLPNSEYLKLKKNSNLRWGLTFFLTIFFLLIHLGNIKLDLQDWKTEYDESYSEKNVTIDSVSLKMQYRAYTPKNQKTIYYPKGYTGFAFSKEINNLKTPIELKLNWEIIDSLNYNSIETNADLINTKVKFKNKIWLNKSGDKGYFLLEKDNKETYMETCWKLLIQTYSYFLVFLLVFYFLVIQIVPRLIIILINKFNS